MSRTQLSKPAIHAREATRRALVALVSLLLVTGSMVCPAPVLAGESHAGLHSLAIPADVHSQDVTNCDDLGDPSVATTYRADEQLRDQFWSGEHVPLADWAIQQSAIKTALFSLRLRAAGPPQKSWPRFTQSWPHAPPV